jgi:hypothetical protein
MTLATLDETAVANAEPEEGLELSVPPNPAWVLQEASSITEQTSTNSDGQPFSLFLGDIDSLLETLDILSDAALINSVRQGLRESHEGKGQDLDDVFTELGW